MESLAIWLGVIGATLASPSFMGTAGTSSIVPLLRCKVSWKCW